MTSTTGPDMMCNDDGNSTPQRLTSRPRLAIAIGKIVLPQQQGRVCVDAVYQQTLLAVCSWHWYAAPEGSSDGCLYEGQAWANECVDRQVGGWVG